MPDLIQTTTHLERVKRVSARLETRWKELHAQAYKPADRGAWINCSLVLDEYEEAVTMICQDIIRLITEETKNKKTDG